MKDYLKKLIAKRQAEIAELQRRSDASQDVAEVRAIGAQLESIKADIAEAQVKLAEIEAEEARSAGVPESAELRNGVVVSSTGAKVDTDGIEYRKAFMAHVLRGTPIPMELRGDENTTTSDVTSVIPTQLVNRIVEKMEITGKILARITRTAFAAGVEIPTSTVKPVASWVNEGAGSDRQKKTTGKVSFTYHKLRCEISMSMEVGTMALSAFESKFVDNVAKAMLIAIEDAIINGNGSGKPKGVLAETPVSGQAIDSAALNYAKICEIEGAVPEEYDDGAIWCMNKKTFMKFVALVDDNGQPVGRVTMGLNGKPERTIFGREVLVTSHVENDVTFIFDFADYALNTVYDMGISKKQDWDTEDLLTKAVMSVDGKVVNKNSLVTFTIAAEV